MQLERVDCLPVVTQLHEHPVILLEPLGVRQRGGGAHDGRLDDGGRHVHGAQLGRGARQHAEGEGALGGGLEGGGEQHVGVSLEVHAVGHVPRVRVLGVEQRPVGPEIRPSCHGTNVTDLGSEPSNISYRYYQTRGGGGSR